MTAVDEFIGRTVSERNSGDAKFAFQNRKTSWTKRIAKTSSKEGVTAEVAAKDSSPGST